MHRGVKDHLHQTSVFRTADAGGSAGEVEKLIKVDKVDKSVAVMYVSDANKRYFPLLGQCVSTCMFPCNFTFSL